jgi:arylsulfatase A-like enzyme
MALNLDLTATILELAGGTLPELDGVSLLPLLTDPSIALRPDFLFEMVAAQGLEELQIIDGVRSKRWKLIVNPDGSKELYRLRTDPAELKNLANRARFATRVAEMEARLAVLRTE